jgi:hypothetical protein
MKDKEGGSEEAWMSVAHPRHPPFMECAAKSFSVMLRNYPDLLCSEVSPASSDHLD